MTAYVKEVKGRLEYVANYEGKNATDVRRRLEEIMNNRGEGLILKHPDAQYILNGRNKDWVKIKPEYMVGSCRSRCDWPLTEAVLGQHGRDC